MPDRVPFEIVTYVTFMTRLATVPDCVPFQIVFPDKSFPTKLTLITFVP